MHGHFCPTPDDQILCNLTHYCPSGSTSQEPCAAGKFCANTSSQVACDVGYFCPEASTAQTLCTPPCAVAGSYEVGGG